MYQLLMYGCSCTSYSCTRYSYTRTRVATHVPATRTHVPATHVLAAHVRVLMYYVPVLMYWVLMVRMYGHQCTGYACTLRYPYSFTRHSCTRYSCSRNPVLGSRGTLKRVPVYRLRMYVEVPVLMSQLLVCYLYGCPCTSYSCTSPAGLGARYACTLRYPYSFTRHSCTRYLCTGARVLGAHVQCTS
jgi:hypothetical protein